MAIVVGIDGSGSAIFPGSGRDTAYDVEFAKSFVSRICKNKGPNRAYFRGPVRFGGGMIEAVAGGHQFIKNRRAAGVREPILLTGYSRGAAGVVAIAARLKRESINVATLMLFDCVDRQGDIDAEIIPNNVGHVMHVVRDPRSSSRESFSNDGLKFSPPTVFPNAYKFMCTHGGMGGCPWKPERGQKPTDLIDEGFPDGMTKITFAADAAVSEQVWNHCQQFLRTHGFV